MLLHPFSFIIIFLFISITYQQSTYSVAIDRQATIIGYVSTDPSGLYFLGIPYAQPPIGQSRFAKTQRNDPSGTIYAFHFGAPCRQPDQPTAREDCLFINVITPINIVNQSYPVYFYIHGGAWIAGSGDLSVAGTLSNIANKGIVVVSINYRLGLYGFFSTRDSIVPGNMAMFDMMEALNWVHRYISYFGGDAERITIGGESAGGWSVSLLTMSPMSQPLFKQAITESGAAFCPTLISYSETTRDHSRRLAVGTNCTSIDNWNARDPSQMQITIDCLRNIDATMLENIDTTVWTIPKHKWGLVIDNQFLNDTLENLAMKRPPINVMIGNCNNETISMFGQLDGISQNNSYINLFTKQYLIDTIQQYHYELVFFNNSDIVQKKLQEVYVDSLDFDDEDHVNWYRIYNDFYSDLLFTGPAYRDAMSFTQTGSDVYLWSFDYIAPEDEPNVPLDWQGVPHTYELEFVFATHNRNTQDSRDAITKTGDFWSNFIIYGNPTPNATGFNRWPKLTNQGEFMSLGPQPIVKFNYHQRGAQFWACTSPIIEGYTPPYCK